MLLSWGCGPSFRVSWWDSCGPLGMNTGAGTNCVVRFSVRARCWRAKVQRFQSHLKKCSVSWTDTWLDVMCGISSEFWIHTAQTIGSCALYYTKVTSISFEKVRCLWVSIYRFKFRESNDRKTNCSVSAGVLSLTLRSVPVICHPLYLFFLYYCFSFFFIIKNMRNNNIRRIGRVVTGTKRRVSDRTPVLTERRVRAWVSYITEQFVFLSFDSRNLNLYKETQRQRTFSKLILVTLV